MNRIIYFTWVVIFPFVIGSCSDVSEDLSNKNEDIQIVSSIKAMSFNVRNSGGDTDEHSWDNRKFSCLAMIKSVHPALIGMQEVRPDQKTFFEDNLKDYIMVGVARDGGGSSTEFSSICFRSDIFKLKNSGTFWLSETPDIMSKGWDGACYRICTWVSLKIKNTDKEIYFFNTHLDHKGTEARRNGLLLIKEKISQIAGDGSFVVLVGDFNMQPLDDNIINFSGFMKNTRADFSEENQFDLGTFNGWGEANTVIDYIWYLNTTPTSYKVINEEFERVAYISDHFPIVSEFELP
ncbi:endonuclease/exonuclease/phosphatase family protein [Sunxiuqinia sp. A32]|uniref:endonuclease/exonuclease/phosphatase family protein n=1 Tax=Sunxiuqinia sp. A32 TaxID=3461496 RepID=UPI004045B9A1